MRCWYFYAFRSRISTATFFFLPSVKRGWEKLDVNETVSGDLRDAEPEVERQVWTRAAAIPGCPAHLPPLHCPRWHDHRSWALWPAWPFHLAFPSTDEPCCPVPTRSRLQRQQQLHHRFNSPDSFPIKFKQNIAKITTREFRLLRSKRLIKEIADRCHL